MDDTGAAARFNGPVGVAADGTGTLYVADTNNHTIRKVVLSTGAVTTLAGSAGMVGSADGTGAAARFYSPLGVATDGAGNLYVSDYGNHTIRKVVLSTGTVTTLAGSAGMPGSVDGTGAAVRFNDPVGVAADGASALYVAERSNHTIRRVVLSTGAVTTLAGLAGMVGSADGTGAAARFNSPHGVAVDGAGTLYVADYGNHTIRKVLLSTGAVTTPAGSAGMPGSSDGTGAAARFNSPYSVAADGAGSLYVADANNHTIRKVALSMGAVTTLAGSAGMVGSADGTGAAARFNSPRGVAVDGAGTLYVVDTNNHTIRKVLPSEGAVATLAGSAGMPGGADGTGAAARFNGPIGVATDGAGSLYVADTNNHTIRKVELSTGAVTTLAGTSGMSGSADGTGAAARFNSPWGVAADGAGSLYVADTGNHTIRKVALSTGAVTTLAGTAASAGSTEGTGAAARFNQPYGVAPDGTGSLYVADTHNHTIRKVVLSTGAVTTLAGTAASAGSTEGTGAAARFYYPVSVVADGTGSLYVADSYNHTIRKVVLSTGAVATLAGTAASTGSTEGMGTAARFFFPQGVAADGAGSLYVADTGNHTIRKIALANAVVTTVVGIAAQAGVKLGPLPGRLSSPNGVAVLPTGEIFIVTNSENALLKAH